MSRSEIFSAAWTQARAWCLHHGHTYRYDKAEFRYALTCAWQAARMAMAEADREFEE